MGKSFNGRNLKNMFMIIKIMDPKGMDMEFVSSKRIEIDDFPLFTS